MNGSHITILNEETGVKSKEARDVTVAFAPHETIFVWMINIMTVNMDTLETPRKRER